MTLSEYICELLYRYNCVIIPEFGAFLTQRIPATISNNEQLFYPPKKKLSFNNQITNNDGLLANYIAKHEGISFESANYKIKQFVQEITNELNTKGAISFAEIGGFTMNQEKNLIFEPKHTVNYLTESFGLATFKTTEITREQVLTNEKNVITLISDEETNTSKKGGYFLKYAAVGVLLLGISGIALNSHKKSIDTYNTEQYVKAESAVNKRLQSASFVFEVEDVLPTIVMEIEKPKEQANYHVIAGAFREYDNATKKLKQLSNKGFEPTYVGENKYGLHQVAYQSFSNKNEAINYLNHLKKTKNPAAWLLTSKK